MLTTFYGYGVRYNGLKYLTDDKKIKYLSTEANMKRYEGKEKEDMFLDTNIYIMNGYKEKNMDIDKRRIFFFYEYNLTIILITLLIVFIVSSILFVGCKLKKK